MKPIPYTDKIKSKGFFFQASAMSSMLQCFILIILIVSGNGNWEKIGERILNKISMLQYMHVVILFIRILNNDFTKESLKINVSEFVTVILFI